MSPEPKKDKLVLMYTNCFVDRLGETLWHLSYHEWFEDGFMDLGPCYATANSERFDSEEVALEVMEKRLGSDNPFRSTCDPREI